MTDLLTLNEAKTALDISTTTFDAELADYISSVSDAVNFICGNSDSIAVTVVVHASRSIVVADTPILSLTSITGDWSGVRDLSQMRFDAYTGVIQPRATAYPLIPDVYTVVYQRGRASVPVAMKQAAKIILKHQWATQRGKSGRRTGSDDPPGATNRTMIPGIAFAIPNAALQMLAPYDRGPAMG